MYTPVGGMRGIRRGRYTWRYTLVEVYVEVYAGGGIREGIR